MEVIDEGEDTTLVGDVCHRMMLLLKEAVDKMIEDRPALPNGRKLDVALVVYSVGEEGNDAVTLSASMAPWMMLSDCLRAAGQDMAAQREQERKEHLQ